MLTRGQEKLIRSLHRKKGRRESGLCLVEGRKVVETAGQAVVFSFTPGDSDQFSELVTTQAPQEVAAVARIPEWSTESLLESPTLVVLDGVQDPGNVGSILRLCLGFEGALLLVESADPTSPKVVRSSVGALFQVPWTTIPRDEAAKTIAALGRSVFKLEAHGSGATLQELAAEKKVVLIAGSEGNGIQLEIAGRSLLIDHSSELESLNVAQAVGLSLHARYTNS